MDMKSLLNELSDTERESLAVSAGTSVGYLWQIAGGHKKPGNKLCEKLVDAEPRLTFAELRPDLWGPQAAPMKRLAARTA